MSDYVDTRPLFKGKRELLEQQLRALDCVCPDGHLLVVITTPNGPQSTVVPLINGARTRKPFRLPRFATVHMGHITHVIIDNTHVELRRGCMCLIPGVFSTGEGVFCITQIHDLRHREELVSGILGLIQDRSGDNKPFVMSKPMPEAPF